MNYFEFFFLFFLKKNHFSQNKIARSITAKKPRDSLKASSSSSLLAVNSVVPDSAPVTVSSSSKRLPTASAVERNAILNLSPNNK